MVYNATLPFYLSPNLTNLPVCPSASDYPGLIEYVSFPSIVFISCALGAVSLLFGLAASIFYNSVPVYEKKEHLGVVSTNERLARKSEVSNTLWIMYFLSMTLRCLVDTLRFSLWKNSKRPVSIKDDIALVALSLACFGVTSFFLTLSLNHQRLHRSEFSSKIEKRSQKNSQTTDRLINNSINVKAPKSLTERIKRLVFRIEAFFVILLGIYLLSVVALFASNFIAPDIYLYIFLSIYCLQRVPIVILTFIIVFNINEEGPKWGTKLLLVFGVFLSLLNEVPETILSHFFNVWDGWKYKGHNAEQCFIFGWFSGVDIIHFCYILAQVFFFIFLIIEFQRNKGPCIWSIVSKRKDGYFDFRNFEDEENPSGLGGGGGVISSGSANSSRSSLSSSRFADLDFPSPSSTSSIRKVGSQSQFKSLSFV